MHQLNEFSSKAELDNVLANFVAKELSQAIAKKKEKPALQFQVVRLLKDFLKHCH